MTLSLIDWTIVVAYLVACVAAGLWMRRYVTTAEDFTVAGRTLDVNLGIASLAATEMGIVTIMYTAQLGFERGLAGATIGLIWAACFALVGMTGFVITPLRTAGVVTIPELFEKRFGVNVRILAGLVVAGGGILNMGIYLRLGGEFLVHVADMPPAWLPWVMTALLVLVLAYTVLGGMLSVLVTDYLQFLVLGAGLLATSGLVLARHGWGQLVTGLWDRWTAGQGLAGVVPPADPFNPFDSSNFGLTYLVWQAGTILCAVTCWQPIVSRVLSARDADIAAKVYCRTALYFVGRFALPGLWGAAAFLYFSNAGGLPEGVTTLTAMPAYLKTLLPVGAIGILIAAMLAAEMSTDSSYLLAWATVIFNDLIAPFSRRPISDRTRLFLTRALVVAIGMFLLVFGLWYQIPGRAWDYLAVTATMYLSSMFTLLVAGLYWPRANARGAVAAMVMGTLGPIIFLVVNAVAPAAAHVRPEIAGLSSLVMAATGMVVGSLLGPAPRPVEAVAAEGERP